MKMNLTMVRRTMREDDLIIVDDLMTMKRPEDENDFKVWLWTYTFATPALIIIIIR